MEENLFKFIEDAIYDQAKLDTKISVALNGSITLDSVEKSFSATVTISFGYTTVTTTVSGTVSKLEAVTYEQFGAVGDGVTDDSQAVQDACDAGYAAGPAGNRRLLSGRRYIHCRKP